MAKILLGITGGISAYKAVGLIRSFTELGHSVKVIPTANALRFVGAATLEALSHNTVDADLYTDVADVKHVKLGQEADLVVVAPASAAFLARFASGLADDLLLNTLLVAKAPVVVAPAMHTEMWLHGSTQANVKTLRARGVTVVDPASGRLTGADSGPGRLPEVEVIAEIALSRLGKQSLSGRRVVITAGGTREAIDAARFIGNYSSGKQGVAIAREASRRGAEVVLIGANIEPVEGVSFVSVSNTEQLAAAMKLEASSADIFICAAAVSDYRVVNPVEHKMKKAELGETFAIELTRNPDLLAELAANRSRNQVIVGFAAETAGSQDALAALALAKLQSKGCDLLIANDVTDGAVFGKDATRILVMSPAGLVASFEGPKSGAAAAILDAAEDLLSTAQK